MKKTKCHECGKKIFFKWSMIRGVKATETIRGIDYYKATCPECGCSWNVKKKEPAFKSDYHPKGGILVTL